MTSEPPDPAIRAFVAGSTGYTGRAVVQALATRDVVTVAHVRPDSPDLEMWRERFARSGATVDITMWTGEAMRATLGALRPALIFALLGTTRHRARLARKDAASQYNEVDFGLTKLLIDAAGVVRPAPRFVYLSSLGAREGTRSAYLRARVHAERALRESGLPYTIARPSFITGPDREESRPLERTTAGIADGVFALAGILGMRELRERYRSMTAPTLARALVALALDPTAENSVVEGAELREAGG